MRRHIAVAAILSVLALASAPVGAVAQSADQAALGPNGDWHGVLNAGARQRRIGMHLGATSTFDSLDQHAFGLPSHLTVDGSHVRVVVERGAVFEGDLSADGARLVGTLSQSERTMPLSLERGNFEALRRPQTPVGPFPYRAEEVGYDNPARPGVHLAGTLTLPQGAGQFPAVLLITGSGREDRDESKFEHRPFFVLADYLTRRGIAVLRVDDRGAGGSTGASVNDTAADFATDVEAGVAYLQSRHDLDRTRIALIGHSEGGIIAPLVANHDRSIAAIVLWSGPGVRGEDLAVEQTRASLLASGASSETAEAAARFKRRLLDAALTTPEADAAAAVANVLSGVPEATRQRLTADVMSPGSQWFIAHDPAPALRALHMPVLALLGSKDVLVVPAQNEPALTAALAGNSRARVTVLPGLNHLFQTATTGSAREYGEIEETIAPLALQTMGDWLTETLVTRARP